MSEHIHRSHNVSVLLYHLVCPAKYRRAVFSPEVDEVLKTVCLEIAERYDITFLEIGTDKDHVHFLIQSIPPYSPTKIARTIKSITAREIFSRMPQVKKYLWGGEFWSDGYYMSTVGRSKSEEEIQRYVAAQGRQKEYAKLHTQQLQLF
jgi:putative transposase